MYFLHCFQFCLHCFAIHMSYILRHGRKVWRQKSKVTFATAIFHSLKCVVAEKFQVCSYLCQGLNTGFALYWLWSWASYLTPFSLSCWITKIKTKDMPHRIVILRTKWENTQHENVRSILFFFPITHDLKYGYQWEDHSEDQSPYLLCKSLQVQFHLCLVAWTRPGMDLVISDHC